MALGKHLPELFRASQQLIFAVFRFLAAEFDPTLDHRVGGCGSGCDSRVLTAVCTLEAKRRADARLVLGSFS